MKELLKVAVLASCMAFFGGVGVMTVLPEFAKADPTTATSPIQIVYYQELKNLGGGSYLCEVWSQANRDSTIIKLTASDKAKLKRAYIK
jgi:hypothetical protein